MNIQKPKGTIDYPPQQKILRNRIVDTIKKSFERYGFLPLETSTLERLGTLTSKFAGGEEIIKEIYKLKDQGKRQLGLRYDLTVPLARYMGSNPTIKMPFKRFEIGKVFRDGPIKSGRLREFWQCDGDVIGVKSMMAEAELLTMAQDVFKKLQLNIVIRVNNRKVLNGLLIAAGITEKKEDAILALDKVQKIGKDAVKKELQEKGIGGNQATKLLELTELSGTNNELVKQLKAIIINDEGKQGIEEIERLLDYCQQFGTTVKFDVCLARGLAYYTGTIYEVFMASGDMSSSICAGGRWDTMISQFLGTKREYPAVGISFGLEPITAVLNAHEGKTVTQVYVISIDTKMESLQLLKRLRDANICADIDMLDRNPGKALQYANTLAIPYVILLGKKEVSAGTVKLKEMESGKERTLSSEKLIKFLSKL